MARPLGSAVMTALLLGTLLALPIAAAGPAAGLPEHGTGPGPAANLAALFPPEEERSGGSHPAGFLSAIPYFTDVAPQMNATAPGYGTGTAWGDYDNDGDLDLYVVNLDYAGGGQANVLLRNDGSTFSDVTAQAGVGDTGPGVAAAWGDMDNDGDLDLFVSNRPGNNALYRNEGDGHFTNVAAQAGVTDPSGWGEGSAWVDHDGDGLLDLYVANLYMQGYQPNRLYHNLDGLHFADVAGALGIADTGNGEGIAWADFDNDGDMDLYIANAYGTNALYQQQADGHFANVTASMHVPGGPGNSFGAVWGDYDNDGWLDLYVAQQGTNKLYRNLGGSDFADVTDQAGVGGTRWSLGCAWGDFDNDGWLDLHVANANQAGYDPGDVLYQNQGGSPPTFADVTALAGVTNTLDARGSAWGDFDGDGALDLYVVNQGSSAEPNRLFHNNGNANHWLHVVVFGRASNRAAVGARVTVTSDRTQIREISGGSGFASQDSLPAEFGLGSWGEPVSLTVRWPGGIAVSLTTAVDRLITVTEPASDLSAAAKLAGTPAITPGQALTYTLVLPNGGDWTAPARLTDTLPLSLTWGGFMTATAGTLTWDQAGRQLLWSGAISPGFIVTITYRVTVNPGLAPGRTITNSATVDDGYRRPFATPPVTVTTLCQELGQVGFSYLPPEPLTGQPITFTAAATGSRPIAFAWDLGDGTIASGRNVTHVYALDGNYRVTLTATNACGQESVTQTLDVCTGVHDTELSWVPPLPLVGGIVTLTASATGRPPITFAWDLGDGTLASGSTVTHTYAHAGTFALLLTATNECGQETVARLLPVCAQVQQADFTWTPAVPAAGQTITFTAGATGSLPIAFSWDWGDGFTGTGGIATHGYSAAGRYTVTLSAENACGLDQAVHPVRVAPGAFRIYLPIVLKAGGETRR